MFRPFLHLNKVLCLDELSNIIPSQCSFCFAHYIAIHEVRNISVIPTQTGTHLSCQFATNSRATCCYIEIHCSDDPNSLTEFCDLEIEKGDSELITNCNLKCSTYVLRAYDIYSNGTMCISGREAVVQHINDLFVDRPTLPIPSTTTSDVVG